MRSDREKLIELMREVDACICNLCCGEGRFNHSAGILTDHLLTNGVVVREKGEWRNNKDDYPECDKCGYMPQYDPMIDDIYYSDFCPNCGADMTGGDRRV